MIKTWMVTDMRIDGGYKGSGPKQVSAFIEKMGLNVPEMGRSGMQEVHIGAMSCLVLRINERNNSVSLTNLSHEESSPTVSGIFPTQAPYKPESATPSPVFEKIWCHLMIRRLNRLEELALKEIKLPEMEDTIPGEVTCS